MPWLLGGLAALCLCSLAASVWALVRLRRMRGRQAGDDWRTSADRLSLSADDACRQMEALMDRLRAFHEQADAVLDARRRELEQWVARAEQAVEAGSPAPAPRPAAPARRAAPRRKPPGADPPAVAATTEQCAEVCRLHESGVSPLEVARRLGLDIGRVELMLNLHRAGRYEPTQPRQAHTD